MFREDWIAALRSGKYKQGTCALRKDGCFCAMGVLCDIVDPSGWGETGWYGYSNGVPPAVARENGLMDGYGTFRLLEDFNAKDDWDYHAGEMFSIVALNDSELMTFDEIADFMEKHNELERRAESGSQEG